MSLIKRMKVVYACLVEKNNQESLFGYQVKDTWYPAVFSDVRIFDHLRTTLQRASNEGQYNINFVAFSERRHMQKIEPQIIRPKSLITPEEFLAEEKMADEICETPTNEEAR